jgi:serine/threonine-protein kinase SRPK3
MTGFQTLGNAIPIERRAGAITLVQHQHVKDLQGNNILLGIEDLSTLDDFEKAEHETPIPRKVDDDRVIYETRILENIRNPGRPVLTDFREARFRQKDITT